MKRCSVAVVAVFLAFQSAYAEDKPDASTTTDKASYGIGMNIGRSIQSEGLDLNIDLVVRGLQDAIGEKELLFSAEELEQAMLAFQQQLQEKAVAEYEALADKNLQDGAEFLAANKKKPGVVTLDSGLQYKVVKSGNGETPKETDTVKTHYRGTLIDGTEFDSSIARGQPAVFQVNGVIRGWTEVLQRMKVGDTWDLYVPSELAYGEHGAGEDIGPNEVLIFQIQLLEVNPITANPPIPN